MVTWKGAWVAINNHAMVVDVNEQLKDAGMAPIDQAVPVPGLLCILSATPERTEVAVLNLEQFRTLSGVLLGAAKAEESSRHSEYEYKTLLQHFRHTQIAQLVIAHVLLRADMIDQAQWLSLQAFYAEYYDQAAKEGDQIAQFLKDWSTKSEEKTPPIEQ